MPIQNCREGKGGWNVPRGRQSRYDAFCEALTGRATLWSVFALDASNAIRRIPTILLGLLNYYFRVGKEFL